MNSGEPHQEYEIQSVQGNQIYSHQKLSQQATMVNSDFEDNPYTYPSSQNPVHGQMQTITGRVSEKMEGLYSNSRKGFIRKVYTLVSLQLLFTAIVSIYAMNMPTFYSTFADPDVFFMIPLALLGLSLAVFFLYDELKTYGLPILIAWTILESILTGVICSLYPVDFVLASLGITTLIVVGLTVYACNTQEDFTGSGPYLFVFCLCLLIFGGSVFFWRYHIAYLAFCCLACFLFSAYLIYDTQLILGRFNRSYSLDDAYFAALNLYIDIIRIFIYVLRILGYLSRH